MGEVQGRSLSCVCDGGNVEFVLRVWSQSVDPSRGQGAVDVGDRLQIDEQNWDGDEKRLFCVPSDGVTRDMRGG